MTALKAVVGALAFACLAAGPGPRSLVADVAPPSGSPACSQRPTPADRTGGRQEERVPALTRSGPDTEVAAREAGSPQAGPAEERERFRRQPPAEDGRAVRSSQCVDAGDARRLDRAPGLARAAAGRLNLFATAPPFRTA